jgi:hypothetical protein
VVEQPAGGGELAADARTLEPAVAERRGVAAQLPVSQRRRVGDSRRRRPLGELTEIALVGAERVRGDVA